MVKFICRLYYASFILQVYHCNLTDMNTVPIGQKLVMVWPWHTKVKVKVIPQQDEVAQGVLGRLRPRIYLMFGTTRVVGHQPYAPAAFTPGENPGTRFQGLSWPQGTWFHRRTLAHKLTSNLVQNGHQTLAEVLNTSSSLTLHFLELIKCTSYTKK